VKLIVAKHMGFCAGVRRAVNTAYEIAESGQRCSVLGNLIHNTQVIEDLAEKGVGVILNLEEWRGEDVIIRAHGIPFYVEEEIQKRGITYIDRTCPHVKTIQKLAAESKNAGRSLIMLGDPSHPEVIGVLGYAGSDAIAIPNCESLELIDKEKSYTLVVQTTYPKKVFDNALETLKSWGVDVIAYETICKATVKRQQEAERISKIVDVMIILGDKNSANTRKLHEICQKNCSNAILVQSIHEIQLQELPKDVTMGITAGASTPPSVTKEALLVMNELEKNIEPVMDETEVSVETINEAIETGDETTVEASENTIENAEEASAEETKVETNHSDSANQTFEEMLNESLVSLHTGDVVKGTVIQVTESEITVNLGFKSDAIVAKNEFTDDANAELKDLVSPGDPIEVLVMRVNDGDGNVVASKRRLEAQTNYKLIEQAFNEKTAVVGKVQDLVKGGLIASIFGNRVFVPSSQISNRYVEDLSQFKGQELNFQILEYDRSKRRIVAGRRELAAQEQKERRDALYAVLEVGKKVDGVVSRIADFGAFVDLGGVDGLIHISELAWRRVRKVSDVLSEGDEVSVTVIDVDVEKNKISLSLKDIANNPWSNIVEKYPLGNLVEGKVVRLAPFGAFVSLEDGVDGLVHISQIAEKHVAKPEDELTVGQDITVKVTEIDEANKKISLSKKQADIELRGDVEYDDDYDDDYYDDDYDDDYDDEAEDQTPADIEDEVESTEE